MNKQMSFRKVKIDDLELVKEVFEGDTSRKVAPPSPTWLNYVTSSANAFCILHFYNSKPIAVTQFDLETNDARISIFIKEEIRGKGLFKHVMNDALSELPSKIKKVLAYISEENYLSITVFKNFGFKDSLVRDKDGLLIFVFQTERKREAPYFT